MNSEFEHLKSVYKKKRSGRNKVKVPVVDPLSNSDPSCDHIILLKCFENQQIQYGADALELMKSQDCVN